MHSIDCGLLQEPITTKCNNNVNLNYLFCGSHSVLKDNALLSLYPVSTSKFKYRYKYLGTAQTWRIRTEHVPLSNPTAVTSELRRAGGKSDLFIRCLTHIACRWPQM